MEIKIQFLCLLWTLCCVWGLVNTAPPKRGDRAGPCIGMDCLHGVMMHGDEKQGDGHKAEDTFNRLAKQDSEKQKVEAGPCKGLDCLHDILHEGEDGIKTMDQKMGPEAKQKEGPEHGMKYMHGVLMHGDDQPGKTHKNDDEPRKNQQDHPPDGPCVDCLEGRLHSTHIENSKDVDDETEKPVRTKSGTSDPDKLLHADGSNHEHVPKSTSNEKKPLSGVSDPDALLHADGEKHDENKKDSLKDPVGNKPVAMDPERLLHGEEGHHEGGEKKAGLNPKIHPKSGTFDPDNLLHGGDAAHVHDASNTHENPKPKVKSETFDPDILLHGGVKHSHEPKPEKKDDEEARKHNENDFKAWLKRKLKSAVGGESEGGNGGSWGFSFPYISDSLLDDIEQMKQRYIIQPIWGNDEGSGETNTDKQKDKIQEKPKDNKDKPAKKFDKKLAELQEALMDVNPEPCKDCDKNKQHAHNQDKASQAINVHNRAERKSVEEKESRENNVHDDMRHELDKIGNTGSFRSDVDVMFNKEEKHKKRHHGL